MFWRGRIVESRDLAASGCEFAMSLATHHGFADTALVEIEGGDSEAAEELERAISLYDAGPGPGEDHWFGGKALAGIYLAAVRLRSGALDAAVSALEPVLTLPATRRRLNSNAPRSTRPRCPGCGVDRGAPSPFRPLELGAVRAQPGS